MAKLQEPLVFKQLLNGRALVKQKSHPNWLHEIQTEALGQVKSDGFPSSQMEGWKHIDLSGVLDAPFYSMGERYEINTLNLPDDCAIKDLKAFLKNRKAAKSYFENIDLSHRNSLSKLNFSLFQNAQWIEIPEQWVLTHPILIRVFSESLQGKPTVTHPRLSIRAKRGAKAQVVMDFNDPKNNAHLMNAVCDIDCEEGAEVQFVLLGRHESSALQIFDLEVNLARNAKFYFFGLDSGCTLSRNELNLNLLGEDCEAQLQGLMLLNNRESAFNHICVTHRGIRSKSRQVYKSLLGGEAVSEFNSMVMVDENATQSESQQLNRNIVLNEKARAFSRPQLKINTDDVKCNHGATVGQMSPIELAYLRSRGLDQKTARSLLTYGFASELLNAMPVKSARVTVDILLHQKLTEILKHVD